MKKSKFATNPVAKKIKKEAKIREAERFMEGLDVPTFHKRQPPNVFMLGILLGVGVTILLGHFFVVMPLLTNL